MAVADKRADEADLEGTFGTDGVRELRFMLRLLGLLCTRSFDEAANQWLMAFSGERVHPGSLNQLHSPPAQDRLANQIRGDGD